MGLVEVAGVQVPPSPATLEDTGIDAGVLTDLVLKLGFTSGGLTTESAADHLCLPANIIAGILDELRRNKLVDILGPSGPFGYRFMMTAHGEERARRLLQVGGYVGPAPVSLEAYTALLEWQISHWPQISPAQVGAAVSELVLEENALMIAGLAGSSGRSLFIHGPPGNGKTTLGQLLHRALAGQLWIPHCIGVEGNVIRLFDLYCHERVEVPPAAERRADRRWVCIKRPFIVVGGELTLDGFDLAESPGRRFYEAPLHLKANGGTFLLDDFGRQRVEARTLLNRWVYPLEHGVDHLTLQTGQKVTVPFQQMLIVCTNMHPDEVTDPALLRRMGYRLSLGDPSPERYALIFERYAERCGLRLPPGAVAHVLLRYAAERRPLRSCEPRDLLERARDVCAYRGEPLRLDEAILDLAWRGYFGEYDAAGARG